MIRLFIKRALCLFFIVSLLSACSEPQRTSIIFGLNTASVTLDPRFATDAVSYRITRLLYRSLVDFDEGFNVIPDLADWQQLSLRHYRFKLKVTGREFHNGNWLTTKDVKATYDSVLDEKLASPHRGSVAMIERIEIIDDNAVDFYLNMDDPLFPGRLVIGVLPASLINQSHPFQREPVGSGPFMFEDWPNESRLVIKRLEDNQQIEFLTVKDPTVRVLKLLRGEVDLIQSNLSPEVVRWLENRDNVAITKKAGDTFTYLGFNLEDKLTGQRDIRHAIAHAIDREAIIHFVLDDTARPAAALLPPEHWAGKPGLNSLDFNPEKSRQLLAKQGYNETNPLKLGYSTSNNPFRLRLATIIQSQLKEVGIEVEIKSYDWGTYYADIKQGRFQMYGLSWVGLKMPDIFRYVFHSDSVPPDGANRGRLKDEQVDRLIETAESQINLDDQADYYQALQEYLLEVLPYIPLWYEDNVLAMRKNITGYELHTDGNFDALTKIQYSQSP